MVLVLGISSRVFEECKKERKKEKKGCVKDVVDGCEGDSQ